MRSLTEIAPGVLVATSSFALTTTTIVAGSGGCLLIDPAIPWDGPTAQLIVHDGHAPGHGAAYLDAITSGKPSGDPRLEGCADWMRCTHEEQARYFKR